MNLSQLQTFLVTAECLSFTEAALRLNLSQPAVSRQMSSLEDEIGTPLFVRSHSSVALTEAGESLRTDLSALLPRLREALDRAVSIGNGVTGHLNLGLLEDQGLDPALSRALRSLNRPELRLSIHRMDFKSLETALADGSIDAAVSIAQSSNAFPGCSRRIYANERMCLAVRQELLPYEPPEADSELIEAVTQRVPFLAPSLDSFQASILPSLPSLDAGEFRNGKEYDFHSIAPMVSSGLAATFVNESHNLSVDKWIAIIPLKTFRTVEKGLFWLPDNPNPMIRRLSDLLNTSEKSVLPEPDKA